MKIIKLLLLISIFFSSCSTSKKTTDSSRQNSESTTTSKSSSSSKQDGSSYENAVMIDAKNETVGVKMEYDWLKEHYPGYKFLKQSLDFKDRRRYDVITITTAEGEQKAFYFDITKFFGKF